MREHESREPFAYIIQDKYERERGVEGHLSRSHVSKYVSQEDINEHEITCTPLYRHAQQPVVPDAYVRDERGRMMLNGICEPKIGFGSGWNACRATMLQGKADGTLTNEGTKQAGNSPAIGVDLASGPDCSIEVRYVAPPGYVMVPKEPTEEMLQASYREAAVYSPTAYRAMIAAAPQSPGSEPATVPGKWIPVNEQMPPSRHEVLVGCWWGEKPRWCCKWATYIPGHPDSQSNGWLIPGASWTPSHWMELPAGPKGVK